MLLLLFEQMPCMSGVRVETKLEKIKGKHFQKVACSSLVVQKCWVPTSLADGVLKDIWRWTQYDSQTCIQNYRALCKTTYLKWVPEPACWFNITPSSWAFLLGKRTNGAGWEGTLSGGEEFPVVSPVLGEEVDCSPAKVSEKDVRGVWPVLWDQASTCSVLEIWTVLGPNVSRRQKLSRHLDKDAKGFFILSSKRGKTTFQQCLCTAPSPTGPC